MMMVYRTLGGILVVMLVFICHTTRSEGDVSAYMPAEQSSNDSSTTVASKAVDECMFTNIQMGCCAVTNTTGHNTAWWRVDLGRLITINWISIFYGDGSGDSIAGYEIYVSNSTDSPRDGVRCHEDRSSTLTDLQTVERPNCPYVAQYVTIYNYRNDPKRQSWYSDYAALALCEVEVKGCPIGSHGYGNCESRCSSDCYGGNCHSTTGNCFYCFPGKYGERCQYTCPTDCANGCNITSGYCTECSAGIYGVTCQNNCPINCKYGICNINSGYCTECISGKFGDDCQQNCSVNCLNGLCYRENGTCHDCVLGKYGINCDNYCRSGCDRETGLYIGISFHNQICIRMFDIIFGICILQSYLPLRVGIDCDVMCLRA